MLTYESILTQSDGLFTILFNSPYRCFRPDLDPDLSKSCILFQWSYSFVDLDILLSAEIPLHLKFLAERLGTKFIISPTRIRASAPAEEIQPQSMNFPSLRISMRMMFFWFIVVH